jgi:hypothetical protein
MPPRRSREVTVAVSGLALVVMLSTAVAVISPPASDNLGPGSSFSLDPDGSAAAYATLQSLGYDVSRSFEAIARLSAAPSASASSTVLVLADPSERASEGDRRALQAFVSAGGTVLATGCEAESFLTSRDGADPPDIIGGFDERTFEAGFPSPLTAGAPRISMNTVCAHPNLDARYTTLYGDGGASVVRAARIGKGLAVWWAGTTPVLNRAIDAPGHVELLLNVIGAKDRTVLWDEFYHGQRRSLYSYAKLTPLPWLVAQTALIAMVAAAIYVRRRAPVIDRFVEARASPLEFVDTMAGLYARADTAGDAILTARARLRRLLLDATGLASSVDDARLAAAAAGRARVDAAQLEATLRASDRHGVDEKMTADEALPLVRRLQAFASALDRRGG